MADMAFHSEAIERLCFACGNTIMKNAHLIEPSLFLNIIEAFSSNITTVENISPRNLCHTHLQPAHLVSCIIRGGTANINFVHNNRA